MCLEAVCSKTECLLARNSTSFFLRYLKTFDFLSFALITSSDEWQSKTRFNLQSLKANRAGDRAGNTKFVSTDKNLKKIPHCSHCVFAKQCLFATN